MEAASCRNQEKYLVALFIRKEGGEPLIGQEVSREVHQKAKAPEARLDNGVHMLCGARRDDNHRLLPHPRRQVHDNDDQRAGADADHRREQA